MTPTDADLALLIFKHHVMAQWPTQKQCNDFARDVLAKWGTPPAGEPWGCFVEGRVFVGQPPEHVRKLAKDEGWEINWLYTAPPVREPLTEREVELIDGMIDVQLQHASRCDSISNRTMAEKQKGWDMERVGLLRKLKAAHGIKGGSDAE